MLYFIEIKASLNTTVVSLSHPADRHLVCGESARLVRADDWSTAERLHRWQGTDYGIFAGHAARAKRQASGNDGRKTCETERKVNSVLYYIILLIVVEHVI